MPWEDILVSSKILGHISSGVYRSAGGALKELVSNAYDANATRVVITTNHPSFDIITCRDNGDGMTKDEFVILMKGGIGESRKRIGYDKTKDLDRPIIGWLGIGMLGIAQVCHVFSVTSHHRESKTAFQATIKLIDFLHEKIFDTSPEREKEDLDVGKFSIEPIEFIEEQCGTYIVASDMRSAFVSKFRGFPGNPLPSKFTVFLDKIHSSRSINELGDYWQMIWELSIACPVPYIDSGPFNWVNIAYKKEHRESFNQIKKKLQDYTFEVIIDGLSLRKPIIYPFPQKTYDGKKLKGELFFFSFNEKIYGRPLMLQGYIYLQNGRAVEPFELRGLLIRIRNVAIGLYDSTFLKYPKIEGPRFNWLSGEIYVNEGLESALNIDRDSFNEMHAHYVKLQKITHNILASVFSQASQGVRKRSQSKREKEKKQRIKVVEDILKQEFGTEYGVYFSEEINTEYPIELDMERKILIIYSNNPIWPRSKTMLEQVQFSATAFEIAMSHSEKERKEVFYQTLKNLLSN